MRQVLGNSGIRLDRPGPPGSAFRNLDCVRRCLHQSTLIITAFACEREYVIEVAARLD